MLNKTIKVIKIINDTSLVINSGTLDSVKKGDEFEIFQPGCEVLDPETNESLGALDYIKATVRVESALPKMSVCINTESKKEPIFPLYNFSSTREVIKTLPVSPEDISGGYENVDKTIRIGDLVRKI